MNPLIGGLFKLASTWLKGVNAKKITEGDLKRLALDIEREVISGQLAVNVEQAKHKSVFVAGARPFIMWGCGVGFLYASFGVDVLNSITVLCGGEPVWIAPSGSVEINALLMGTLGMSGIREGGKYLGNTPK